MHIGDVASAVDPVELHLAEEIHLLDDEDYDLLTEAEVFDQQLSLKTLKTQSLN